MSESFATTIQQMVSDLRKKHKEIEDLQSKMKTEISKGMSDDLFADVISFVYWDCNDIFNMKLLSGAVCLPDSDVRSIAGYKAVSVQCSKCSSLMTVQCASRAALTSALQGTRWCPDCEQQVKARNEEDRRLYRQTLIAQDARRLELRTMPYADYLQTPEWKAIRARVLRRARYACELCFKASRLNVHHKTYERRGNENFSDLIVLCSDCHAKFHDKVPA